MRITTDRDRCIGSGNCAFYAPGTFDLDDALKVIVLPGAEDASVDGLENVRAAVEACPVKALGLVDGDEHEVGLVDGDVHEVGLGDDHELGGGDA